MTREQSSTLPVVGNLYSPLRLFCVTKKQDTKGLRMGWKSLTICVLLQSRSTGILSSQFLIFFIIFFQHLINLKRPHTLAPTLRTRLTTIMSAQKIQSLFMLSANESQNKWKKIQRIISAFLLFLKLFQHVLREAFSLLDLSHIPIISINMWLLWGLGLVSWPAQYTKLEAIHKGLFRSGLK